MAGELDALRRRIGPPPRTPSSALRTAFARPAPPAWMTREDGLNILWREHDVLVRHGDIAIGYIFMANTSLFEPGDEDAPGGMVHSFDPYLFRNPDVLEQIGTRIFRRYAANNETKQPFPLGPWFQTVHAQAIDDVSRMFGLLLPPTMTAGHVVYLSTPMLHRPHLRSGVLEHHLTPVLAARDPRMTATTLVMPAAVWSPGPEAR